MKSCKSNKNVSPHDKDALLTEMVETVADGTIWRNEQFSINFQQVVEKCIWNSDEMNCSYIFINRVTDLGLCFTFNPGLKYAKFVEENVVGKIKSERYFV